MRTVVGGALLALAFMGATPGLAQVAYRGPRVSLARLADGVYVTEFQSPVDAALNSNALLIVNDSDVVVVDSHGTPEAASEVITQLRQITSKPVRYVINTHWHGDHHFGNQAYRAAYPDVEFISHPNTIEDLIREEIPGLESWRGKGLPDEIAGIERRLAQGVGSSGKPLTDAQRASLDTSLARDRWWLEQLRTVTPITAGITVTDSLVLYRGRRRIEVRFLGRANTRGDLIVYLPQERIVATGDVVVHPMPYGFGSYLGEWVGVLDRLHAIGATTIVPGHGRVLGDWSYPDQLRALLVSIRTQARAAVEKGDDLEATRRAVNIDSLRARFTGGDANRARVFDANFTTPAVERAWLEARGDTTAPVRIDSLVSNEARAGWFSGTVLVARGDRTLFQRGYSFADRETRAPNNAATLFGIGSITKAMTELVVNKLAAEGRLDLDAPVSRYLGPFPKGPDGGQVTARHLLDHRSGVPWRVTTQEEEARPLSPADIVERVRGKGLLFEPGTRELYSSAGFTVLARVVEIIEGRPFDLVLRDRIFRPASMSTANGETGRSRPYRLGAVAETLAVIRTAPKDLSFLTGAGSLYTTAADLLHFVRSLRKGVFGKPGQQLVADSAGITWQSFYGRTTNGYEASVDYDPKQDVTFVLLSNLQSAATFQLRAQVRNLLLGRDVSTIQRPPPVAARFESPESFVGPYGDPDDPIIVEVVEGHLLRDGNEFYPIAGQSYYVPASGSVMRFSRDSADAADAMLTDWLGGQKTRAAKIQRRP